MLFFKVKTKKSNIAQCVFKTIRNTNLHIFLFKRKVFCRKVGAALLYVDKRDARSKMMSAEYVITAVNGIREDTSTFCYESFFVLMRTVHIF